MNGNSKKIAVIGGIENLGLALARRWVRGGHELIVGSRTER